jgi:hypothetical protein
MNGTRPLFTSIIKIIRWNNINIRRSSKDQQKLQSFQEWEHILEVAMKLHGRQNQDLKHQLRYSSRLQQHISHRPPHSVPILMDYADVVEYSSCLPQHTLIYRVFNELWASWYPLDKTFPFLNRWVRDFDVVVIGVNTSSQSLHPIEKHPLQCLFSDTIFFSFDEIFGSFSLSWVGRTVRQIFIRRRFCQYPRIFDPMVYNFWIHPEFAAEAGKISRECGENSGTSRTLSTFRIKSWWTRGRFEGW